MKTPELCDSETGHRRREGLKLLPWSNRLGEGSMATAALTPRDRRRQLGQGWQLFPCRCSLWAPWVARCACTDPCGLCFHRRTWWWGPPAAKPPSQEVPFT